jgi:hypothetical protein
MADETRVPPISVDLGIGGVPEPTAGGIAQVIAPIMLLVGDLLAHHEALEAALIERGTLSREQWTAHRDRYLTEHRAECQRRVADAFQRAFGGGQPEGPSPPR